VPVDRQLDTLHFILSRAEKYNLTTRIAAHAGDGNIHLNILKLRNDDYDEWKDRTDRNQAELFTYVYCAGGRLSGEHGIGYKRRHLMERFADPVELSMMRAVKKALDPNNILNPGKIFTLDD
uniref:FAD-linked oxidase C-terminal domain-containing protein n=1 Tax=Colibacter massiliensis TaxID=1852379 RepID=UPI003C6F83DB